MTRKPQTPEEVGVPVSRNSSVSGLKPQNGYVPPKLSLGSPSPRLSKAPPHRPTVLDEPGKKVRKPAPLQHSPPTLGTSPESRGPRDSSGSRRESCRPGSWDGGGAVLSASPKLRAAAAAARPQPQAGDERAHLERPGYSGASPERSAGSGPAEAPLVPRGGAAPFRDSQGTPSSAAGPSRTLLDEDPKAGRPQSPALNNAAPEPASVMSPPPAKKPALSAKKVGVRESHLQKRVRDQRAGWILEWGQWGSCAGACGPLDPEEQFPAGAPRHLQIRKGPGRGCAGTLTV